MKLLVSDSDQTNKNSRRNKAEVEEAPAVAEASEISEIPEESENAWGEEDDLDLSTSGKHPRRAATWLWSVSEVSELRYSKSLQTPLFLLWNRG